MINICIWYKSIYWCSKRVSWRKSVCLCCSWDKRIMGYWRSKNKVYAFRFRETILFNSIYEWYWNVLWRWKRRSRSGCVLIMKKILIKLINIYQWFSKFTPSVCRFYPTCSEYMKQAIIKYGVLKGGLLGIKRILKCHPFHPGGYDPVP